MKRIISLVLCLSLLFTQAYALETYVDRDDGSVAVYGANEPDSQVTLIILKNGKTKDDIKDLTDAVFGDYVEYIDQTVSDGSGQFMFNFGTQDKISFQRMAVFINRGPGPAAIDELNIVYYTSDSTEALAKAVIDCTSSDEIAQILDEDTIAILELDRYFYSELDGEKQQEVLNKVAELEEGDAQIVKKTFLDASVIAIINSLETEDDVSSLMSLAYKHGNFEEIFGFKNESGSYYNRLKEYRKLLYTNILKKTDFDSVEEFADWCVSQLALTCVKCFKSTTLESVLEEFEQQLCIDMSKINKKNETEVYTALAGKTFDTAEEFSEAFDNAVENADKDTSSGSSGGSGGKGGSRGSGGGFGGSFSTGADIAAKEPADGETTGTDAPTKENKVSFPDVDESYFAHNAISHLGTEKIISGYPDGTFRPEGKVTRAEFIKMISVAMLQGNGDKAVPEFTDMPDDAWYKPYAVLAVSNGIVNGISENEIGAELEIKREELFTMIYRVCILKGIALTEKAKTEFSDADTISSFASEAIQALADCGIISGYGGLIRPSDTATRGECAKILYEIMKQGGKV